MVKGLQMLFASMWIGCLSTYNPDPPNNGTWIKPTVHPCQQHHRDIQNSDSDYIDLLNTVQRNTLCTSNYCLLEKRKMNQMQISFSILTFHA